MNIQSLFVPCLSQTFPIISTRSSHVHTCSITRFTTWFTHPLSIRRGISNHPSTERKQSFGLLTLRSSTGSDSSENGSSSSIFPSAPKQIKKKGLDNNNDHNHTKDKIVNQAPDPNEGPKIINIDNVLMQRADIRDILDEIEAGRNKNTENEVFKSLIPPEIDAKLEQEANSYFEDPKNRIIFDAETGIADAQNTLGFCYRNGVDGFEKNLKLAYKWYKAAADQGHPVACYNVGFFLYNAIGLDQGLDYGLDEDQKSMNRLDPDAEIRRKKEAAKFYKKAAEKGVPEAQHNLASIYEDNQELYQVDMDDIIAWYEKAADHDIKESMYNLSLIYRKLEQTEENLRRAFKFALDAAGQNMPSAQTYVADAFLHGKGIEKDVGKAIYYYKNAAEMGDADAQLSLGILYGEGTEVDKNPQEAFRLYKLAAEQGSIEAIINLGLCYAAAFGTGQENPNVQEAIFWFKQAAEKDSVDAMFRLAVCYSEEVNNDPEALKNAFYWFKRGAEKGEVNCQFRLAGCYSLGRGVEQNHETAFKWYTKAADSSHIEALFNLACCYMDGVGTIPNENRAYQCFLQCAEKGVPEAQFYAGMYNQLGSGTEKNEKAAFEWFEKAAQKGIPEAQFSVGNCYCEGMGVQKNEEKAVEWFRKASEQGNTDAQFNLANCLVQGIGVRANQKEALKWYIEAAEGGVPEAKLNAAALLVEYAEGDKQKERQAFKYFYEVAKSGDSQAMYNVGVCYQQGFGVYENFEEARRWIEASGVKNNLDGP